MNRIIQAKTFPLPNTIIAGLSTLVIMALCLYGVMIFTIVHRVAYRQSAESIIAERTYALGELESKYIALKNSITNAEVVERGFTPLVSRSYINNKTLGVALRHVE